MSIHDFEQTLKLKRRLERLSFMFGPTAARVLRDAAKVLDEELHTSPDYEVCMLAIQAASPERPLGEILVTEGLVSADGLEALLVRQRERLAKPLDEGRRRRSDDLFGRVAVELAYARPEQVAAALAAQLDSVAGGDGRPPLGWLLVEQGAIDVLQFLKILEEQGRRAGAAVPSSPTGAKADASTTILRPPAPPAPLEAAQVPVDAAPTPDEDRLADAAVRAGLLAAGDLERARRAREIIRKRGKSIGLLDVLRKNGFIDDARLRDAHRILAEAASASTSADGLAAGRRFGRYEILQEVGRGGMGVVFKAVDPHVRRTVALKVLLSGEMATVEQIARFQREASSAARLRHPNVVAIHDVGKHDGRHYYTMDFVEGVTLAERIKSGTLPLRDGLAILQKVADALQAVHDSGIVHRDVKPANIVLDARGDVYSLGAVLYELATGRPPFEGSTALEVITKVATQEPLPPRRLAPSLHRDVETICLKAMAKEKDRRYATARDCREDLRRWLAGETIIARPAGRIEKAWKKVKRNKSLSAAIALALVVAGGVAARELTAVAREARLTAARERRRLEQEALDRLDEARGREKTARDKLGDDPLNARIAFFEAVRLFGEAAKKFPPDSPAGPEAGRYKTSLAHESARLALDHRDYVTALILVQEAREYAEGPMGEELDGLERDIKLKLQNVQQAEDDEARGGRALDDGDFDSAIAAYTAARDRYLVLGDAKRAAEIEHRMGEAAFGRALAAGAREEGAGALLAALDRYEEALRLRPGDEETQRKRSSCLARIVDEGGRLLKQERLAPEEVEKAVAQLRRAWELSGDPRARETAEDLLGRGTSIPEMLYVAWGRADLGSTEPEDRNLLRKEVPMPGYYLGKGEVTNAQFAKFVAGGGYARDEFWDTEGLAARNVLLDLDGGRGPEEWRTGACPAGREAFPVTGVSIHEARAYARWLAATDPAFRGARLPTEDEWERAASGDLPRRDYPWGLNYDPTPATIHRAALQPAGVTEDDVGPFLHRDLGGNVHEWVEAREAGGPAAVLKGGSWSMAAPRKLARAARRGLAPPELRADTVGFRLALDGPRIAGEGSGR